ncbi:MAG: alpha-glucan family phosphorylase [Caldilineaceae bacterium]|nr:alpha-glucan family phosphorylase [Caldilineaceae bacterium]
MKLVGKVSVFPKLPPAIERLQELAYNLWWSWEANARALYARIDPELWEEINHNPVKFLRLVDQAKLTAAAEDSAYLAAYNEIMAAFDAYMSPDATTWFKTHHPDKRDQVIAYFSAEFGLHEALPIYSGGLGILSGDHCKAASDLDLPFVGVGFLYPQGYFTQIIDSQGVQQAQYEKVELAEVPATPALDSDGNEALIQVDLPGRTVYAKVWRIQVGRIPIFLMDTDVERNAPQDRELSARLYGGDREMRISQEVVLGIGGVRAVRALGISPAAWHMNEGHSAFLGLERVREKVQQNGLSFDQAVEAVRANTLFTTHTPVPAGNDTFAFELVEKFFWQYWGQLGIDRNKFIDFAGQDQDWGRIYSMTVLALKLSAYHNGVSELHGHVSRAMWNFLWPDLPVEQTPIGHVTNGIHTKTWLVQELKDLYGRYLPGDWQEEVDAPATWDEVDDIPDAELWSVHQARKSKLIDFARERVKRQYLRHGEGPRRIEKAGRLLNPNALTIGFARRFATYKRATLLFRDQERLKAILNHPERPVQIVFSGKAHPADEPGKALIREIYELSQQPDFEGKILFIENYDINIARHMISGVDVWLNNPRRPHEASGTSGEKAAASGAPNLSILDGWWVEGYDGSNGWAIGEEREYKDQNTQDEADALSLYQLLEDDIVPLYYEQDEEGVAHGWVQMMKNSIRTCAPRFSMRRMVKDYVNLYYLPAAVSGERYQGNGYSVAKEVAAWKALVRQRWHALAIEVANQPAGQVEVGESIDLQAQVWLNGVNQASVAAEIISGTPDSAGNLTDLAVTPMAKTGDQGNDIRYAGKLEPTNSGQYAIGVRARPDHPDLINAYEMGLSTWA